jgi:biopolymer transport protein ExbD
MPKVAPIPEPATHGRRGRRVTTSLAEINVVPLVDVMLVLLIIFMVAAPMMTQGMPVDLPQAKKAPPITAQQVYVTVPASFAKDHVVQLDKDQVRIEILPERVRQAMLMRADKSIFVRADGAVAYRDLVTVMDRLKEGGIDKVGLVTRPEGTR